MEAEPLEIELIKRRGIASPQPLENGSEDKMHFKNLSEGELERLKEVQGQCRIQSWQYLKVNYPKGIFFGILMTISIVGLLFIKYFRSLRAKFFYTHLQESEIDEATDIYVTSEDKLEEICDITEVDLNNLRTKTFLFKHLKYEIMDGKPVPLVLHYQRNIEHHLQGRFLGRGINRYEAGRREQFYGKNEHRVEIPNYFQFLFDTMTQPFFIFQYFVSIVYILQSLVLFGVLMVFFSWLTTTINYFLLRRSYNKIKETAEKEFLVKVLRDGIFYDIKNVDLVPGDLYQPNGEIPCDSIIVQGELFVDQASLTGENVPIAKFKLLQGCDCGKSEHWVFEGSTVQTVRQQTLALAINVGYASRRGRIIRKILTKVTKQPQFFKKLIYFMLEVFIVLVIVYAATIGLLLSINITTIMVVFRFLDYITYAFPAPFPIYFNLVYSFCLVRLNRDGIIGTEAEKTVESGRMKTICFDKTGTLTQTKMQVKQVFAIKDEHSVQEVTQNFREDELIAGIFGCCNSVEMINNEPKGDQIDLRLFLFSKAEIKSSADSDIVRQIIQEKYRWEVLRINQYESKFQSMSVLVRNKQSKKYYIFVKGSPEMIHLNSTLKYDNYEQFIKKLSLQGYRSIGFGFRQVNQQQIGDMMKMDRGEFIKNVRIIGVVTFVNLVKTDARQTIDVLADCGISTKIITGDNIFLGIQTAFMTGMLPQNVSVGVVQGRCYNSQTQSLELLTISRNSQGEFTQNRQTVNNFSFESEGDIFYAVDNDFIKGRPDFLHHRIKVFARISPENKALIVRKHKELYQQERVNWNLRQKIFGECGLRVGMVGDGANDLIAIKEADVGIGIASSDAVYSASFTVQQLFQIDEIIRQAKNTERQVVDLAQFYGVAQFLSLSVVLVLTKDASYPSSMMLIWRNFTAMLIIPLFYGLSRPAEHLTRYLVNTNFMGLEHHLVFWGNAVIATAGFVGVYQFLSNSSVFVPNPRPYVDFENGYNGETQSATLLFVSIIPVFLFMGVFIYRSSPWKEPFYKNIALTILFILNFIQMFLLFFGTKYLSFLGCIEIPVKEAGICLGIMLGTMVVDGLFNWVIEKMAFHEKEEEGLHQSENVRTELIQHNSKGSHPLE